MLLIVKKIYILLHERYDWQDIKISHGNKYSKQHNLVLESRTPNHQTEHPSVLCAVQQLKVAFQSSRVPTSSMSHCFTSFPSFKYSLFQHTKYVNLLGYSSFWIVHVENLQERYSTFQTFKVISYKPYFSLNHLNNWYPAILKQNWWKLPSGVLGIPVVEVAFLTGPSQPPPPASWKMLKDINIVDHDHNCNMLYFFHLLVVFYRFTLTYVYQNTIHKLSFV